MSPKEVAQKVNDNLSIVRGDFPSQNVSATMSERTFDIDKENIADKPNNLAFWENLDDEQNGSPPPRRACETAISLDNSNENKLNNSIDHCENSSEGKAQSIHNNSVEKYGEFNKSPFKDMVVIGGVDINSFPTTVGHIRAL